MQTYPKFSFYVSDTSNPVEENSDLWKTPLPSEPASFENQDAKTVTLGDYFSAAEIFFKQNDYRLIRNAVLKKEKTFVNIDDIHNIDIFLVKHGRFYHPARVNIVLSDITVTLALNSAVSKEGCECVEREYPVLEKFNTHKQIPSVFGKSRVALNDTLEFNLFIAEWFSGYHEFHISFDHSEKKIIVWDDEKGNYYLSPKETFDLYRQATKIMASCYDTQTFEQIQPWHHAAGDFILKKDEEGLDLRLITIRQFTSLFENSFNDAESILEASVLFFINLSIRMRLDRVDGVKETVWADDLSVEAILKGFLEGIETAKRLPKYDESFAVSFTNHISRMSEEELLEFAYMLIRPYPAESPDLPVIMENIENHINSIAFSIKKITTK